MKETTKDRICFAIRSFLEFLFIIFFVIPFILPFVILQSKIKEYLKRRKNDEMGNKASVKTKF